MPYFLVAIAFMAIAYSQFLPVQQPAQGGGSVGTMSRHQVYDLAQNIVTTYGLLPDPLWLVGIAGNESDRRAGELLARYEPGVKDHSYGMMQTLWKTAKELHDKFGYNDVPLNAPEDLANPYTSMYFAAAYLTWLMRWKPGLSEEYYIRSYNAGHSIKYHNNHKYWNDYLAERTITEKEVYYA